uniref:Uncharacterized protein n=1 Tax=Tetraselmis chuii TaxID=63592 RepID=A0A7S1T1L7_9CHLO|mmetsp:Transcript_39209/g.70230  ORF Transcript_39209/g.70230 Transcript_39209/m.70230 type:complete len:206 (+) Transcript_39209:220-837(+)|eukprot:CAMPEP_0177790306 /NCGR_PEP_ID=MMETSP0491_2-20121128/23272_1 /TAXON_ID=63592 /ORGANISM="Tetraselmis chuii, Strain PLY429" /LENGTH=205 /DNA_ID=CAMNT_0019312347 /DNA_START=203 /DNA_END=820 /DNA_ORIENTATION=-
MDTSAYYQPIQDDARGWLMTLKQKEAEMERQRSAYTTMKSTTQGRRKGATETMARPMVCYTELKAGMFPDNKTGFKDPKDPCNKTNKSNGGEFSTYASTYSSKFSAIEDKKLKFREDGVPVSANRTSKSLMSPKLPSLWERTEGRRNRAKNETTNIVLGDRHSKDSKFYETVHMSFHKKLKRGPAQAHPGIASTAAAAEHRRRGL